MIKERKLSNGEYQLTRSSGRVAISVHRCQDPEFTDQAWLELIVDGEVFHRFEGLSVTAGQLNSKVAVPIDLDKKAKIELKLLWDTEKSGKNSLAQLRHQSKQKRIGIQKEILGLKRLRSEITSSRVYRWFGYGMETVLELTVRIKKLDGTLQELLDANEKLTNSWQFTAAVYISEGSPVGVYSRVVQGKTLMGDDVSGAERALEALFLGVGVYGYIRIRRHFRMKKMPKTQRKVPDICEDIAPRLHRRRRNLDKVSRHQNAQDWNSSFVRPSGKMLDQYSNTRLQTAKRKVRAITNKSEYPKYQSWVTAKFKGDKIIIKRAVLDGQDYTKVIRTDCIEGSRSELLDFVFKHMEPNPKDPSTFFAGCHHDKIPDYLKSLSMK